MPFQSVIKIQQCSSNCTKKDGVSLLTNTTKPPLPLCRDNISIAYLDNILSEQHSWEQLAK